MSKMQPPTLEVVRFDNEDVVVASGGWASALNPIQITTNGAPLVALGSEILEEYPGQTYRDRTDPENPLDIALMGGSFYQFEYWPDDYAQVVNLAPADSSSTLPYAWYNGNRQWFTENKTISQYSTLPTANQ